MLGAAGLIVVLITVVPVWAQDGGNEPGYCGASCEPALEIAEDPNLIFPSDEFFLTPTSSAAAALEEPAVLEEPPALSDEPPTPERAAEPIVVESEGVSDSPTAEDGVPAPLTNDQTDEQAESAPAESVPAKTAGGGIAGSSLEAYDNLKVERRLLGFGIIALTLIIAALMAWRLPLRRNVEEPAAWGIPQEYSQEYDENYASPEAPTDPSLEAPPEYAKGPEGEPSSAASGPPPEEVTPAHSASSSSPARATEGAAAASAYHQDRLGQERLNGVRHLGKMRQRRSPRIR